MSSNPSLHQPLLPSSSSSDGSNSRTAGGQLPSIALDSTTERQYGATSNDSNTVEAPAPVSSPSPTSSSSASQPPPKERWMRTAERAVRGFERRKAHKLKRKEWGVCSLSFPNEQQEKIFLWYFAQLREKNMRGSMLLLVFFYILYATVEWRDEAGYSLTISRAVYVAVILGLFCWSYARPLVFRMHIQEWTLSICLITSLNILIEAALLNAVYSPFVVIILLLFLLSSSVLVRLRFAYTSLVCWSSLALYDLLCVINFRGGDSTISGGSSVGAWLAWYNCVLIFTIVTIMKIAHRVEVQSRYEFLTTATWTEKKHKARKRKKQVAEALKLQQQYQNGAGVDTAASEVIPAAAASSVEVKEDSHQATSSDLLGPSLVSPVGPNTQIPGLEDSSSSDSDANWSDEDDDEEAALVDPNDPSLYQLDSAEERVDSALQRINAGLLKKLQTLFFVQQPKPHHADHPHHQEDEEQKVALPASSSDIHVASAPPVTSHLYQSNSSGSVGSSSSHHHSHHHHSPTGVRSRHHGGRRGSDNTLGVNDATAGSENVDQMTNITKALQESGVTDMIGFLAKLSKKPDQHRSRTSYGYESDESLPDYFLPYPYIKGRYRVNFSSQMCWQSLFRWHNETLNVWSEFVPLAFFFVAFFWVMWDDHVYLQATATDRIFVSIGLLGALVIRPLCSGLAHLLYCQSERAYVLWWGIDYCNFSRNGGYCVNIDVRALCLGLPEQQSFFYVSLIGLFLSTIISVLFVSSNGVRTGSFLLFVLFATGVPFFYAVTLKLDGSSANAIPATYFYQWIASLGCFLVGLIFKSTGFPECCSSDTGCVRPGFFDVFCASHLWWHICVNVGNMMSFFVWRQYLEFRQNNSC